MSPPREALGYRPALDGIRALAIAGVVLLHAIRWPEGGALGVDLFFVLSGFLITTLLLEEHAESGVVSFRAFYRRRAYRLLPALFTMLGVYLAVAVAGAVVRGDSLAKPLFGVVAGVGYFTNLAQMQQWDAMPASLGHLWSLAEEEQFYLAWPLVLFALLRARVRLALVFLIVGVGLSTLRAIQLNLDGASEFRMGIGLDTAILPILAGCVAALLLAGRSSAPKRVAPFLGPVALLGVLAFVFAPPGRDLYGGLRIVFALCAALLIVSALDADSFLGRALALRGPVYVGRISYSLYLWHIPVLVAFGVTGESGREWIGIPAVGVALVAAVASYHLVEQPFLRRKRRPRRTIAEARPVPVAA